MKKNKTYTIEEIKNLKANDLSKMGKLTEADKIRIRKNGRRLVDPVKEKDFVDYLKYLADK